MKLLGIQAAIGSAILLLSVPSDAKHSRALSHLDVFAKRHSHKVAHASPRAEGIESGLEKRGTCPFPTDAGLVAVTPGSANAGWAMSPDQTCTPNSYCPYACPPGQVMEQWDPDATSYTFPESLNGGLRCDASGSISKPFPNKPYCSAGTNTVGAQNNCGSTVSFCQTVLPGNEAMLIPTEVDSWMQLAVPDTSYWCGTAAHYYINAPGVDTATGCVWSDGSKPLGNWAAYVGGANTDSNGNTFIKIGWNPIFTGCDLSKTPPTYGVRIDCEGPGCNGSPCSIDPSVNGVGGVTSQDQASGAGGANFCVVTASKGTTANIVVFNAGSSGSSASSSSKAPSSSASPTPTSTKSATPTTTSTTSSTPSSISTTSSSSSSSTSLSSTLSLTTSSSSSSSGSSSSSSISSTSSSSSSSSSLSSSSTEIPKVSPHILFENVTSSQTMAVHASVTANATITTGKVSVTGVSSPGASPSKKSAAEAIFVPGSTIAFAAAFAVAAYLL